jgi:hypothetical protein
VAMLGENVVVFIILIVKVVLLVKKYPMILVFITVFLLQQILLSLRRGPLHQFLLVEVAVFAI